MPNPNPLTRAKKKQALEFFQRNRLDESKSLYAVVCKADRRDADAWNMLGAVHGMLGEYREAEACCREVIALNPKAVGAYNNLANALKFQEKIEEAKSVYLKALAIQPDYAEAHNNLGNLLREQGDLEGAERCFRKAISLQSNYAEAHNNLGAVLREGNKPEEAYACFWQAARLNPAYFDAVLNLGVSAQFLEKYEDALACFRQALQLKPDHFDSWGHMGNVLEKQGKLDDALECYRRLMQLKPDSTDALLAVGGLLFAKGQKAEAIAAYRQVLQIKPDAVEANYFLAALGEGDVPLRSPEKYVKQLFDSYADRFDKHLVEGLHYHAPEFLLNSVERAVGSDTAQYDVIDLGCGTGLCGPLFRGLARRLVGVDLSPKMLGKARARNVYEQLIESDVVSALAASSAEYDLVISTDVFIYIGDLLPVFAASKKALKPGGLFAFSTETAEGVDYELRTSGRYAHSRDYIGNLASAVGLSEVSMDDIILRTESEKPMPGNIFVFRNES